jgi:hypothetical protein
MTVGLQYESLKKVSALRRVPSLRTIRTVLAAGNEGDICAFELLSDASAIIVEATDGRLMTVVPGDTFLATPGYRESTRWVVGGIPADGLLPGKDYWVLSDSGVVGELIGDSPLEKGHLGRVRYLGATCRDGGKRLNISQFRAKVATSASDRHAPVYLILGTSSEVGKTTAGVAVVRSLLQKGHTNVIALKATGTSSFTEIARYRDFGVSYAFDCIDFGLPTTYPSGRTGICEIFDHALDYCCSLSADALVIECGGDLFGANVPQFLEALKKRRSDIRIILAAPDALAAIGAKRVLEQIGLSISLITGPCTDTPTLRERTQALCEIPAAN